jgi:hypothetical protein
MVEEFEVDAVDKPAAQLFVQILGAWVVTGRHDRIRDNEISAAATNAYQEADAFMKNYLERHEGLTLSVRSTVKILLSTRYPDAAVRSVQS